MKIERNPIEIIKLEMDADNYDNSFLLIYNRIQGAIRSKITDEKVGVLFRMETSIGNWFQYIAEMEFFIEPINAVDLNKFINLIKLSEKTYLDVFNNGTPGFSQNFSLELPVLDESEAEKQFQEFCEQ